MIDYISKLYSSFAEKASLRLKKGESNILEESTAEIQNEQAKTQLDMLEMI